MARLGLETDIVDNAAYKRTIARLRELGVRLPTLSELAEPDTIPDDVTASLADVDPDAPNPLNLFRVHWFNGKDRRTRAAVPDHIVLTEELTGVASPILVLFGNRFPMIRAHKVLAAYGCLVPRLVTGQFDATAHRAIWPSTGNYCRGGVAISRVLGCRGVAVLPEGMSAERFRWLEQWVSEPSDIVRTVGTESNVKEIYDKCNALEGDPQNVIFNQFCEFGNHLIHYHCTGPAIERAFEHVKRERPDAGLAAFVSATGSAGTIAAGDYLKDKHGARIVAAEALECPTMLYNGFGEHNIQGIGDKHIPFIHNVTNTDVVVAISDHSTDALEAVFNSEPGRAYLRDERGVDPAMVDALKDFGLSSICNVLGAIKTSKQLGLGKDDVIATVATDGSELYVSEMAKAQQKFFANGLDTKAAAATIAEHLDGADTEHTLVLSETDQNRIFNLGYFTWVEQQGVSLDEFEARRSQQFWRELRPLFAAWDKRIGEVNRETGVVTGS
jgi:cysteine synthase